MKLFKVPKQRPTDSHKPRPTKIVGIIDSSGSMADCWPLVAEHWNKYVAPDNAYTITFDHNPHLCRTNILENSVKSHGGGKTNLVKVFKKFETKLEGLAADSNLTIIFISDGEDNVSTDLDKEIQELEGAKPGMCINFLCLGIGSGFPTFLSMYLRGKYHTGSPTVPAIFLIEYVSAKAFLNKFESMKQYFVYGDSLAIMPPVMQYPWEKPVEAVHENTWIVTDSNVLDIEGTVYDLTSEKVDLEGAVGLFKGWLQRIHLESLKPGHADVKLMAVETLKMMQVVADQVKKERGIDILNAKIEDEEAENLTFHQRVMRNLIKNSLSRALWYYEEVKLLAEGKNPKELDKYEAAKRIGIGTIVGKYHQKALALKGITVGEFRRLRDVFADTYKETKLSPNSSQEGSVVTLQNQKEVFLEPNFLEALTLCNNQFDLVESFPVIGLAIKIKRFSGSMVNPWLTKVEFIARHHKIVDSISVVKSNNNLQLKIGENNIESVNAVLPVYEEEDQDMKPLLTSKLYHLLMNFNVSQNVDTLYEDAYLALLSNTLVYLLTQPDSDWKKELLEKIYTTVKLVYYEDSSFLKYREGLLENPVHTISEDEEQKKYGNMDLSKAALHVFTIVKDGLADKAKVQKIMDVIIAWFFYYTVKDPKFKIEAYCKCKLVADGHKKVVDMVKKEFRHFYTLKDLKKETYATFDRVLTTEGKFEPFWDLKGFYKADTKINLENIQRLSDLVTGKPPNKEEVISWLARTYVAESFQQVFNPQNLAKPLESITRTIGKQILIDTQKNAIKKLSASQAAIDELTVEFKKWYEAIHSEVVPLTEEILMAWCAVNHKSFGNYVFDKANGLLKNACVAKNCPFYLKVDKQFHMHLKVWEQDIPPAFHATVMKFAGLSDEEIYEKFVTGQGMKIGEGTFEYDAEKYKKDKEEVMHYIARIKTRMLAIKG